jgi:hypothetical protein
MEKWISLLLLLVHSLSALAGGPTVQKVMEQLSSVHGAEWKHIIHSPQDILYIKNQLKLLMESPDAFFQENVIAESDKIRLQHNAIAEYGNFIDQNQEFEARSLVDAANQDSMNESQFHQWIYSLKNSGSLVGFDALEQNFLSLGADQNALRYKLLRFMTESVTGVQKRDEATTHKQGLTDYHLSQLHHFAPHLAKPWYERSSASEWRKRKQQLLIHLSAFSNEVITNNHSLAMATRQLAGQLSKSKEPLSTTALVVSATQKPTDIPTTAQQVTEARAIAQEEMENFNPELHGGLKAIGLFVVFVSMFFVGLFWMIKRK